MATPGGLEPPTNSLEGCCSIQLSYGARHQVAVPEWHVPCSMGPVVCPAPFVILRIRFLQQPLGRRLEQPVSDAVALGIGDSLLPGGEAEPELLVHVARRRPPHQRIGGPLLGRLVVEHPAPGIALARLHGGSRWSVNPGPGRHDRSNRLQQKWSGRPDSNQRPSAPKADALPDCATPRDAKRPHLARAYTFLALFRKRGSRQWADRP